MEPITINAPVGESQEKYYCPFHCGADECDENGYCGHLVGFTTDQETIEPIEEQVRYDKEEKQWYPTGYWQVNGKRKEEVQPGDKLVNPKIKDKDWQTGQEYEKRLWVSWRVYSDDPDREPVPVAKAVAKGPRAKHPVFESKARQRRSEEKLAQAAPDDDIEVNPRKRSRKAANTKAQKTAVEKPKGRISTDTANADVQPADTE